MLVFLAIYVNCWSWYAFPLYYVPCVW